MAKGKKTGGKNFPKGQSGNPAGRPALPADVKALRTLNQVGFVRMANRMLAYKDHEIQMVINDPDASQIEKALAQQVKSARTGALWSLEFLLQRLIGRAPDQPIDPDALGDVSDEELIKLGQQAAKVLGGPKK